MYETIRTVSAGLTLFLVLLLGIQGLAANEFEYNSEIRRFETQARAVAVDPEGRHLYVSHAGLVWHHESGGIGIYRIDPSSGRPLFVALVQNGENGADGLEDPGEIIVSPDGRHVYVAGSDERNSLVVFSRERGTGHLIFVETLWNNQNGAKGLNGISAFDMSADARFLYVCGEGSKSVAAYARDAWTGKLTFVQWQRNGQDGVTGLQYPRSITLSPGGEQIYAAGTWYDAIVVFARDPSTGTMTYETTYRDGDDGIQGLDFPVDVTLSPDGTSLYAAAATDDAIVHFERNPLNGHLTYVGTIENGVGGVHDLDGPVEVFVSADGAGVVVAASTSDALVVFQRDQSTGELTFAESHVNQVGGITGLDGPASIAGGPGDARLYLGTWSGSGVPVFEYDSQSSTASFVEAEQDVPEVDGLWELTEAEISGDGKNLYVAAAGTDSVVALTCDSSTGHLSFLQRLENGIQGVDGIDGATAVAVSPDDANVYVAGTRAIGIFDRNSNDGSLIYVGVVDGVQGLIGVESLALSPDGNHLYAASKGDDALVVFDRNSLSGALTFKEVHTDGENGVDGLNGAVSVVVSPDGRNICIAAAWDNAVSVFSRNPSTGSATFLQVLRNNVGGVVGLLEPRSVTLSSDGLHLYSTGESSHSLAVFARDSSTGELTFVEAQIEGIDDVNQMTSPKVVRVSPEGTRVYVSSSRGDAVVYFSRDVTTGALTYLDYLGTWSNRDLGTMGLQNPNHLTISSDGLYLFVNGAFDDQAVVGLRRWQPAADGVPSRIQVDDSRYVQAIDVEPCAQKLTVNLSGLSANLDLSTRFGQPPTASDFDCRSDQSGTADEQCVHDAPTAGRWWVAVDTADYAGSPIEATLTATVEGCDEQNQVSWWRADGGTEDELGPNDGIPEGGLGYAPAVLDQAFVMAADGDAVVVPGDVSLDAGVGDFSYSMWLKTTDRSSFRSLLDSRTVDPTVGFQLFLDNGHPGAQISDGSGVTTIIGRQNLADGKFHHVTVAVNRDLLQGLRMWVDRKLDTLADPSREQRYLASYGGILFGRRTDAVGGEGFFNGMIDEVRFTKRAVSSREAADVFGGLRSWWPGDGETSDHGGVNHAAGSPGYAQGRRGMAFEFGAMPDDHLVVPHHSSLDFGAGDLSIAVWLKSEQALEEQVVLDTRKAGPVGFALAVTDGKPKLYLADGTESAEYVVDQSVADGLNHLVAVTIDRSASDGIGFWVDGVLVQTFDPTSVAGSIDSGEDFIIGRSTDAMGAQHGFQGLVDELEIYDRVLNEKEIAWLFTDTAGFLFLDGFDLGDLSGWSSSSP